MRHLQSSFSRLSQNESVLNSRFQYRSTQYTMNEQFDELLLDHIRYGRNDEADAMLNEDLAKISFVNAAANGTLLHHAAEHNNAVIARRLIELGADVDRFGTCSSTPLTTAVAYQSAHVIEVLLEANARIDVVDDDGSSALQLGLHYIHIDSDTFKLLTCKLRLEAGTSDEVAELLIRAGCNMCHAATLRDIDVMECMLKRGVDVSSRDAFDITALFVAVELNDLSMADWLVKRGIDVDAIDEDGSSALTKSVEKRNKVMVQFLLENGAFTEVQEELHDYTPLCAAFLTLHEGPDEIVDCVELLLRHGASLQNSTNLRQMFESALNDSCDEAVKLLIAHLAMLEKLGKPVNKSVMLSVDESRWTKMSELRRYYEPCLRVLAIEVFEKTLLIDLMNESDRRMRLLLRKERFLQEVEKICSEHNLSELYSYYYNSMMRRIEKASRVVKLEDQGILVICKIFEANYNQFYGFARGVVEYLNERDLEHLVQV